MTSHIDQAVDFTTSKVRDGEMTKNGSFVNNGDMYWPGLNNHQDDYCSGRIREGCSSG